MKPSSQTKNDGQGTLSYADKVNGTSGAYQYAIVKKGEKVEAQLSAGDVSKNDFISSLFDRRSEKYYCTAETPGEEIDVRAIGNFELRCFTVLRCARKKCRQGSC